MGHYNRVQGGYRYVPAKQYFARKKTLGKTRTDILDCLMISDIEVFLLKYEVTNKCWNWLGVTSKGYGKFYIKGNRFMAHRVSYELFKGKIPESLSIDHLCENKLCVNPEHLEAVTLRENSIRVRIKKNHFSDTAKLPRPRRIKIKSSQTL